MQPDTWHLLTGTWKSQKGGGDGLLRLYVDGVFNSVSSDPLKGLGTLGKALLIGWDNTYENSRENRHFNGLIDEVMIYDRALSENEIKQIFDAQK